MAGFEPTTSRPPGERATRLRHIPNRGLCSAPGRENQLLSLYGCMILMRVKTLDRLKVTKICIIIMFLLHGSHANKDS